LASQQSIAIAFKSDHHFEKLNDQFCSGHFCTISRRSEREAEARRPMSAPVPLSYTENSGCTEREKDPAENNVIHSRGEDCAEERQSAEQNKVARLGVHFRSRLERGSDQAAPLARDDGLEPFMLSPRARWQAIFLGAPEPRAIRPEKFPPRTVTSLVGQGQLALSTVGKKGLH
jgi:hypothetical protein